MTREELVADGLVDVGDAESFTGLKKSKLYQLMESGELPFVTLGRRRLIPRRALVQLAADNLHGVS
ncbi:MAG TPA: helix-turn-helix domain-containing protein [Limnochordia bacterium]|nr:helix-turn-helix domain-containing protein [Limnochordia bacterium]